MSRKAAVVLMRTDLKVHTAWTYVPGIFVWPKATVP
jgi:hypothetical protein